VSTILPLGEFVVRFHVTHCIVTLAWTLIAVADVAATAFAQIICVPSSAGNAYASQHFTTGAFAIFFMHPSEGRSHESLTGKKGIEDEMDERFEENNGERCFCELRNIDQID
jgi:hypothetical protein